MLAFFAFQTTGTDPRIGTWTLVSAQSNLTPANTLVITPVQDGIHVVMSGETHFDFTAGSKGHPSPAPGNLGFNQIELHRIDKKTADVKEEKDGALVSTVREKISNDGNELTTTTTATGHSPQITVWDRTGGKRDGRDPFAGEWTQDLTKTRMRQGMTLHIDSDGRGGTSYKGDYSYTARLDGKPYDLQNSRNDSISLALTDPRTVDATSKRDNQVTQKDHWQVSPDGQQMTLNSTSVLETGQHITEKLIFRKQ